MQEIINDFKIAINQALEHYENSFNATRPLSLRRSQDIMALRTIINQSHPALADYFTALRNRLAEMNTGWWIFHTGRSRLRSSLLSIISVYDNPTLEFTIKRSEQLEYKITELTTDIRQSLVNIAPIHLLDDDSDNNGDDAMDDEISSTTFSKLKAENERLRSELVLAKKPLSLPTHSRSQSFMSMQSVIARQTLRR